MELTLERTVERGRDEDGSLVVDLHTDDGVIRGRRHEASNGDTAVLWVSGAAGGLGGPAGGMYTRLANVLAKDGIASLRLDYRRPGHLSSCVLDVIAGVYYLSAKKRWRVVLVGHSFGGAVVIGAGVASASVIAVAALSSQMAGAGSVGELSPKPLLLIHGRQDEVLPCTHSSVLLEQAREPKRLLLYDGTHGLDECRDDVDRDLLTWIREVVTTKRRTEPTARVHPGSRENR